MDLQVKNLKEELAKALSDDKHNLAGAFENLLSAVDEYKKSEKVFHDAHDEMMAHLMIVENANRDLLKTIRNIYTVLNADLENAKKVNGMTEMLDILKTFVISATSIKGMVNNETN